jgi:transposase
MIDLEELFERSDELRNILDESSETEQFEYINQFTADEIGNLFEMLLIQIDDPEQATKYLQVLINNCLYQIVDARTKRERKHLSNKTIQIMRTYFGQTHRYTEAGYKVIQASQDGRLNLLNKTVAEHEHIKELAEKIAQKNPKLSKSAIAKILKRNHDIKLAESTIRDIIRDREIAEDTDPFSFD